MKKFFVGINVFLCVATLVVAFNSRAADFPDKNITAIIPYKAGGGSDTITRLINNYVKDSLGHEFNFVYKTGGGGAIGVSDVAKSKNDGYTIGAANIPHVVLQSLTGSGDFEVEDFNFISQMAVTYPVFVTPKDSPYKDLESFIKAAKEKPGTLTIGLPGALGNGLIGYGMLMEEAGIECAMVNFSGGSDLLAAVLGQHIDAAFSAINMTIPNKESMNLLAVSFTERDASIPDVPTFQDLGYEVSSPTARIYLAPADLPQDRLDVIEKAFKNVFENDSYRADAEKAKFTSNWMGNKELEAYVTDFKVKAKRYIEKYTEN